MIIEEFDTRPLQNFAKVVSNIDYLLDYVTKIVGKDIAEREAAMLVLGDPHFINNDKVLQQLILARRLFDIAYSTDYDSDDDHKQPIC